MQVKTEKFARKLIGTKHGVKNFSMHQVIRTTLYRIKTTLHWVDHWIATPRDPPLFSYLPLLRGEPKATSAAVPRTEQEVGEGARVPPSRQEEE